MTYYAPPKYLVKVTALSGAVVAGPLPCGKVTFSEVLSLPNGGQQMGSFTVELLPPTAPASRAYRSLYAALDYWQRVEIYENVVAGDPVFAGYIAELPQDLQRWAIAGPDALVRLEQRQLAHFEPVDGQVHTLVRRLLKTWQPTFKDDFNRATIGSSWTVVGGSWDVQDQSYLRAVAGAGPGDNSIRRTLGLTGAQEAEFKLMVEVRTGVNNAAWTYRVQVFTGGANDWRIDLTHPEDDYEYIRAQIAHDSQTSANEQRDLTSYELEFDGWALLEIRLRTDGGTQYLGLWLDGREILATSSTAMGTGGSVYLVDVGQKGALFDNFAVMPAAQCLAAGAIATTTATYSDEYQGGSHLQAIKLLCDVVDWEYRLTPKAGAGNDRFDCGPDLGTDHTGGAASYGQLPPGAVVFQAGKNLQQLSLCPSGNKIATHVRLYAEGQDVHQVLAQAVDFAAWDRYGIIEEDISDSRISRKDTARSKAANYLAQVKDGEASLDATVLDGPATAGKWRVGDWVWVRSRDPAVDKACRVLQIDHESGSPLKRVIFDNFPWNPQERARYERSSTAQMARTTRLNAGPLGPINLHLSPTLIDCDDATCDDDWLPSTDAYACFDYAVAVVTRIYVDGTDRTSALGGPWSGNRLTPVDVSQYVSTPGIHCVEFLPDRWCEMDFTFNGWGLI